MSILASPEVQAELQSIAIKAIRKLSTLIDSAEKESVQLSAGMGILRLIERMESPRASRRAQHHQQRAHPTQDSGPSTEDPQSDPTQDPGPSTQDPPSAFIPRKEKPTPDYPCPLPPATEATKHRELTRYPVPRIPRDPELTTIEVRELLYYHPHLEHKRVHNPRISHIWRSFILDGRRYCEKPFDPEDPTGESG